MLRLLTELFATEDSLTETKVGVILVLLAGLASKTAVPGTQGGMGAAGVLATVVAAFDLPNCVGVGSFLSFVSSAGSNGGSGTFKTSPNSPLLKLIMEM